jgi:hypothetical protein
MPVKLLVGWWSKDSGELVSIPGFDRVSDPGRWLPVSIEVSNAELVELLMLMAKRLEVSSG